MILFFYLEIYFNEGNWGNVIGNVITYYNNKQSNQFWSALIFNNFRHIDIFDNYSTFQDIQNKCYSYRLNYIHMYTY